MRQNGMAVMVFHSVRVDSPKRVVFGRVKSNRC